MSWIESLLPFGEGYFLEKASCQKVLPQSLRRREVKKPFPLRGEDLGGGDLLPQLRKELLLRGGV